MTRRDLAQRRPLRRADLLSIAAARPETAAGRRINRRRNVPFKNNPLARLFDERIRERDRRQQRLTVRMRRIIVQRIPIRQLDNNPQIHDRNPVADMPDHRQVVRDKEIRQVQFLLQVFQQVDHLRLDRDVERRNRLVADYQLRLQRQRARHADPLPLTAGKFMRITVHKRGVQPDQRQQLRYPPLARRAPVRS